MTDNDARATIKSTSPPSYPSEPALQIPPQGAVPLDRGDPGSASGMPHGGQTMRLQQRLQAPHDVNGNPRKLTVVYRTGRRPEDGADVEAIYDVGYGNAPAAVRRLRDLGRLDIGAAEYRRWKRLYGAVACN